MNVIERTRSGPVIRVRAKPNARRDAVVTVSGERLVVAVRASPEHGKANAAVVKTVARWLGVPPSRVEMVSGGSSRDKRVLVHGIDVDALVARIGSLLG
ncbi:MAG: DUF167 domain-containing protein [Actinomycetota bacterium]